MLRVLNVLQTKTLSLSFVESSLTNHYYNYCITYLLGSILCLRENPKAFYYSFALCWLAINYEVKTSVSWLGNPEKILRRQLCPTAISILSTPWSSLSTIMLTVEVFYDLYLPNHTNSRWIKEGLALRYEQKLRRWEEWYDWLHYKITPAADI